MINAGESYTSRDNKLPTLSSHPFAFLMSIAIKVNFREAVIRCSDHGPNRGKSGHQRAGFPVKTGGACVKAGSRPVQQKTYRLPTKARVKRWGKSPPLPGQPRGQCKPNPMQGEIGNRVARSMVSGTPHPLLEESMFALIDK